MTDEKRNVVAIVRKYIKDGEEKNIYENVGTAWVSEHGNKISIQLNTVPVSPDWNGKLYITKSKAKEESGYDKFKQAGQQIKDKVIEDVSDEAINFSDIPF